MKIICDKCNNTIDIKNFKKEVKEKVEIQIINNKKCKVYKKRIDYICPNCGYKEEGDYEPIGYN